MTILRETMKPGDIVYHRRTGRGPFKIVIVGDYDTAWTRSLEPGWFIHDDDGVYHELIEDYEVRNKSLSDRFDPWPMSPLGTTGKKRV